MMSIIRPRLRKPVRVANTATFSPPRGRCAAARRGVYLRRCVDAELMAMPAGG
jgi:hypothetical protein